MDDMRIDAELQGTFFDTATIFGIHTMRDMLLIATAIAGFVATEDIPDLVYDIYWEIYRDLTSLLVQAHPESENVWLEVWADSQRRRRERLQRAGR